MNKKLCTISKNYHRLPEGYCCTRRYTSKINNDNEKFSINNYYHLKDAVWDYEKVETKVFLRNLKTQGLPISNKDWNFQKQ